MGRTFCLWSRKDIDSDFQLDGVFGRLDLYIPLSSDLFSLLSPKRERREDEELVPLWEC